MGQQSTQRNVVFEVEEIIPEFKIERSNVKVRYSDADLGFFRRLIEEKIEERRECIDLQNDLLRNDQTEVLDTSPGSLTVRDDFNLTKDVKFILDGKMDLFVKSLTQALVRVDLKTYGVCRDCGMLIPRERLMAVPHATLCISHKN